MIDNHEKGAEDLVVSLDCVSGDPRYLNYVANYFFLEVFLALNLSSPGSFDFYRINMPEGVFDERISNYSSNCFESALHCSDDLGYLKIGRISFFDVWQWLRRAVPIESRQAETGVQIAVFGLLHLCEIDVVHPISSIWVAHILEGLYGTDVGQSFNSLLRRSSILLDIEGKQLVDFKKRLRSFYDYRSKFVHGKLRFCHPVSMAGYDDAHDEIVGDALEVSDFGYALIVASIQAAIRKNLIDLQFEETISLKLN